MLQTINPETMSSAIDLMTRATLDLSPCQSAKRIIKLFGYNCFCDKFKNGTRSIKLATKHGTPIPDSAIPYELTGILCQLATRTRTMGYAEHDRYNRESPIVRSATESTTRYYFA